MRTTLTLLIGLALIGGAAAISPPASPACGDPALEALCLRIVIGDIIVLNGQEEEFNNGTYVMQGSVTVESGGRVEIILSDVAIASEGAPIRVKSGGTLIIDGSTITAAPDGSPPLILAESGAHVEIYESDFSGIELQIRTQDLTARENDFTQGDPAVRLVDFDGTFGNDNTFHDNTVALNVTRGAPTIQDLVFARDGLGISLFATSADLTRIEMTQMLGGILAVNSQGTYSNMALSDRSLPPTTGVDLRDTSGQTTIRDSEITQWGVGIRTCNADLQESGNDFSGNGEDRLNC